MKTIAILLGLVVFCLSNTSFCQEAEAEADGDAKTKLEAAVSQAEANPSLKMPEPPVGYSVVKHSIIDKEAYLGFTVQVTKEDSVSKVIVTVEHRDFTDRGFRSGATKAYVNSWAKDIGGSGFELVEKNVPDIGSLDLVEPVIAELKFKNEDTDVFLWHKSFFNDARGFSIVAIATDEDEHKSLTAWANRIESTQAKPIVSK